MQTPSGVHAGHTLSRRVLSFEAGWEMNRPCALGLIWSQGLALWSSVQTWMPQATRSSCHAPRGLCVRNVLGGTQLPLCTTSPSPLHRAQLPGLPGRCYPKHLPASTSCDPYVTPLK